MNHLILKSNTNMTIGNKPMVLLPLDIYEKLTKIFSINTKKIRSKKENLSILSESSLSKDWSKLVEEKAWQNL